MNRMNALIREGYAHLRKIKKDAWIFFAEILLMLLICMMHSVSAGHYANFFPINGTFQNFNPVRRLLDGQIPYRDFQDYLGMGHLYIGSIITAVFGGDYQASLQAFSFLTFSGIALLTLMVSMAMIRKKEIAVAVTNIILIMLLIKPLFLEKALAGTEAILEALEYGLGTGNSARIIRGMILPIACLLLYAGYRFGKYLSKKYALNAKQKEIVLFAGIGLIAGFSFVWSNDYGISCWVCFIIVAFWLSLSRDRKFFKAIRMSIIEAASSLVSIFITVEVFTLGHFGAWFSATFGTGGYQSWYYNSDDKSYYLYDVDFTYIMLIQAGLAVMYLFKLFVRKGSWDAIRRYGMLGFANMVCFCAVNEYKVLSGGRAREVALTVLFLTVLFEVVNFLTSNLDRTKGIQIVFASSTIISLAWLISTISDEVVFTFMTEKEGVYVDALGGSLTSLGEDLNETDKFLDGKAFWATYASAQEVVSDTYQPSGTDYIIHVLGDKQRKNYLNLFQNGDFTYTATIRDTYTDWEYWVQRANWFFYRELYKNWHPVYANTYELYWARNAEKNQNMVTDGFMVNVEDIDASTKKIIVQCDTEVNGIADVYIDYAVKKKDNNSAKIVIQTALRIENTGTVYADQDSDVCYESNNLRPESAEYVPVPVVNGYGEVTIMSNPVKSTYIDVNDVKCTTIYTVASSYLTVSAVLKEDNVFEILHNDKNQDALNGVSELEINHNKYKIIGVSSDEVAIYIAVDGMIPEDIAPGSQIKLKRASDL